SASGRWGRAKARRRRATRGDRGARAGRRERRRRHRPRRRTSAGRSDRPPHPATTASRSLAQGAAGELVRALAVLELRHVAAVLEHDGTSTWNGGDDVRAEAGRHELVHLAPEEERGARQRRESVPEAVLAGRLLEIDLTRGRKERHPTTRAREHA